MSSINYGQLLVSSMRQLVLRILAEVEERGLEGDNHFLISFLTEHGDVRLPPRLHAQHPKGMTIVLQHEFHSLKTDAEGFSVTLSFDNRPESIYVPVESIVAFADPSTDFRLAFPSPEPEQPSPEPDSEPAGDSGKIVRLDSRRAKRQ